MSESDQNAALQLNAKYSKVLPTPQIRFRFANAYKKSVSLQIISSTYVG